jgi:hypothetical protein
MTANKPDKHFVKKNVAAIHIKAKLSLTQRKMNNVLLRNAYDTLLTADEHEIPVPLLCELAGIDGKNLANLKRALTGLTSTSITWDVLGADGDEDTWGFASFLSGGQIKNGICTYRYDKGLAKQLYRPDVYSRINLGVIKKIRTSHALVLYENCYRFVNQGHTGWWDLDTFRDLMGLSENKSYRQFKDLNKHVIKPAIAEVNQVSNILLEMEHKRTGRSVSGIRFLIRINPQLSFERLQDETELDQSPVLKRFLKIHDNRSLARGMIQEYGEEQISKNLDYVEQQLSRGKVKSAPAFLKAAVQNNYISEEAKAQDRRRILDEKADKLRRLEEQKAARESKIRDIERAYSTACMHAMMAAFDKLDRSEQRDVEEEFLNLHSFGSFQTADFHRQSWESRMVLPQAVQFWMKRGINLPRVVDLAKKQGIEDFETYKLETEQLALELETA